MFNKISWLQRVGIAALLVIAVLGFAQPVYAQGISPRDTIPAGETVEGDALLFGDKVKMSGTVTGDLFIIGRQVEVDGQVDGSLYIIGQNVAITSQTGGSLYLAGMNLGLGQQAVVQRHAYILGLTYYAEPESQVAGDLTMGAVRAWLSGRVGRHLNAVILLLNVTGSVGDSTTEDASARSPKANGVLSLARLAAPPPQDWMAPFLAPALQDEPGAFTSETVLLFVREFLRRFISYLLIGGLLIWLLPGRIEQSAEKLRKKPWASLGWGVLVFFGGYLVLLALAIAIPIVAYQLWQITLWGLSSILISLGFSLLGIVFTLLTITILYGTKLVTAWLIGKWLVGFSSSEKLHKPIWPLLIGILIVTILRSLSTIGGIFGLIITMLGLGAIWLELSTKKVETPRSSIPEAAQELAA